MEKTLIASMGIEGGGATIYGRRSEGVWMFWTQGSTIDLDENDLDFWRSWSTEPVNSLDDVLPSEWPVFSPIEIHPDFLDWFREAYEKKRSELSVDKRRYQDNHVHERWSRILCVP
jgi:hypothetical protein